MGWKREVGFTVAGTVAGVVGGYLICVILPPPEVVRSRWFGMPVAAALAGSWDPVWRDDHGVDLPKESIVDLKNPSGAILEGAGATPSLGKYELSGVVGEFAIAFSYRYPTKEDLVGVVLLKRAPDAKSGGIKLEGTWSQFSAQHDRIVTGTTVWTRTN